MRWVRKQASKQQWRHALSRSIEIEQHSRAPRASRHGGVFVYFVGVLLWQLLDLIHRRMNPLAEVVGKADTPLDLCLDRLTNPFYPHQHHPLQSNDRRLHPFQSNRIPDGRRAQPANQAMPPPRRSSRSTRGKVFRLADTRNSVVVVMAAAAVLALGLLTGPTEAFAPRQQAPQQHQQQQQGFQQRQALTRRGASEEGGGGGGGGGGLVDKLFGLFFGKKEERPLGFDRISVETSPEVYPAVTDKFADALPGTCGGVGVGAWGWVWGWGCEIRLWWSRS